MADFSHIVRLSKEEVEQAILALALTKKPHGFSVDAHTFHTKAAVSVLSASAKVAISGAEISWQDE